MVKSIGESQKCPELRQIPFSKNLIVRPEAALAQINKWPEKLSWWEMLRVRHAHEGFQDGTESLGNLSFPVGIGSDQVVSNELVAFVMF